MIELKDITKVYHLGEIDLPVLKGISLRIEDGEFVSLTGASGSGKSTLMNLLGCLDHPTSGEFWIDGHNVAGLNANERALLRNKRIGFVFQNFNLLARTSALENVMMPAYYYHPAKSTAEIRKRALELIEMVGLTERMHHTPAQLSGGQQQRVLLARALCAAKKMLLLDEPVTGLDPIATADFYALIRDLNKKDGVTIIMVSHDLHAAIENADKILQLRCNPLYYGPAKHYAESEAGKKLLGGDGNVCHH